MNYWRLIRPVSTLSGTLAVLLGGYVAGTGAWGRIGWAMVVTLFVSGSANAWNDAMDMEIDQINQPKRMVAVGLIPRRHAIWFSVGLGVLAVILSVWLGWGAWLMTTGSVLILYLYSWRLKSTVLIGNGVVATVSAMSALFGGLAAGDMRPAAWLALVIWVSIMSREILKTLADYEGDLRFECRTVATVWGRVVARRLFYLFWVLAMGAMLVPYGVGLFGAGYLGVVLVLVWPLLVLVGRGAWQEEDGLRLEYWSQVMKYGFFVWFVAVVVG